MTRAPSAAELLDIWEDGLGRTMSHRALALLSAALPGTSGDALATLSIGRRDAELLRMRETLWGPMMTAVATCPACREKLDLSVDTREILSGSAPTAPGEISVSVDDYSVTCRPPTTLDMVSAEAAESPLAARAVILSRCLLSAQQGALAVDSGQLPPEVVAGIAQSIAAADPLAEIQLKLHCSSCGHQWRALFDIVSFLWTEIEAWAWRMLGEVHTLARAYGWREQEILRLTPTRRRFYLEMVGA
jgi:hypothetical protein